MKFTITNQKEACLIYDVEIENNNLSWGNLNTWWLEKNTTKLSDRLFGIYKSDDIGRTFLNEYLNYCRSKDWLKLPALIPEVYLHYDPKTVSQLKWEGKEKRLTHQRMDFLMLINGHRVVIELDGKQHYSVGDKSSPEKYAEMIKYDREMKLMGYDVFRFGGYEFTLDNLSKKIHDFFNKLILKYAPHLLDM